LDQDLRLALGRSWLGITRRGDKVFGCLHGSVDSLNDRTTAVRASRMQIAYIDGGDCYGADAVGVVVFRGPKPADIINYYLEVSRVQTDLLCDRPSWLTVGVAYDTTDDNLRTSWLVKTRSIAAKCDSTASLADTQIVFALPRPHQLQPNP
jgi:hypothetical protein